jgi:hypothetical protein
MLDPGSPLRSWLRKAPKPARVRAVTEDGEQKLIEIPADARTRWKGLEEAVLACRAATVECLDSNGTVLRAQRLHVDDEQETDGASERREVERFQSRERREMGSLLDAYGRQINAAFDRGAAAANTGQEHLVDLVTILTQNLATAITNVHNLSVNLANALATGRNEDEGGPEALLGKVMGLVAAKAVSAPVEAPPNGKQAKR